MKSSNKTALIGTIIGLLALPVTACPALAGGIGDNSISTTNPSPSQTITGGTTMSSSTQSGIVSPITQVNQQSGVVQQFSNLGSSPNLSPPNCYGGCAFAITRVSPSVPGSSGNVEAIAGVTWQLGSNDGGAAELNRLNGEMTKYRTEHEIKLALSEKLAEALENGKTERATIIAMNLAPMLGYKNHQLLLNAVSIPKTINPQIINR